MPHYVFIFTRLFIYYLETMITFRFTMLGYSPPSYVLLIYGQRSLISIVTSFLSPILPLRCSTAQCQNLDRSRGNLKIVLSDHSLNLSFEWIEASKNSTYLSVVICYYHQTFTNITTELPEKTEIKQ